MAIPKYVHLHRHDTFSLLDGLGTPEQAAKKAKELGYKYLGVSNHGNVDGLIKHQKACEKEGIIPIAGTELFIVPDNEFKEKGEKRGHITVFIKNKIGWQNILKILSNANLNGFYYRPRTDFNFFLNNCEGLIVSTACHNSFILLKGGLDFFLQLYKKLQDDLYLEVMPHDIPEQIELNKTILKISEDYNIPIIGTLDSHYIEEEDWETHEILLAMQTKAIWNDPNRWKFGIKGLYLCPTNIIMEKFENQGILNQTQIRQALSNTYKIAQKCEKFRIEKQQMDLPEVPQFKGLNEDNILRLLCEERLRKNFEIVPQEYKDRFEYEFSVLKGKNFIRYFLIVYDLVNFCRKNNILVGPGRGSVGGCLIAYLMGITMIDPIKYDLLFERFINPGRQSFPDIDLDFMDTKRDKVIAYLQNTYGQNQIASVTTFLKLEDRSVVKDVARVFEVNLLEVNNFTKTIVEDIETAIGTEEGRAFNNKYPNVIKHALKLRGQYKAYGRHAAASIISPEDLNLGTRANLAERSEQLVVNWDMEDCEYQGLMKLDVLALNTLSVVNETQELIKQNYGKVINLEKLNLEDPKVYKEISAGHNEGCFQICTWSMNNLIKEMGVDNLHQLSDAMALVRPGAFDSGATEEYIKRKKGKTWTPKHHIYEEITEKSFGICCYQEQIMFVFNKVADLSLQVADDIRRIIGKKRDPKEFEKYKDMFINGCLEKQTLSKEEAHQFWVELQAHASYSFNIAHALAYAILAYWTAWLKKYYPYEFLAASLSKGTDNQKEALLKEAKRLKLEIIPPKIVYSHTKNWVAKGGKLFVPFSEVKGIGNKALEIIEANQTIKDSFFNKEEKPIIKGKLKTILDGIGAFTDDIPETIDQYFKLNFVFSVENKYPNLNKLIGNTNNYNLDDLLTGNIRSRFFAKEIKPIPPLEDLISCTNCELRRNCKKPLNAACGLYNVMIVGESGWTNEFQEGKPFVGDSGKILWDALDKHGYDRSMFYVTNAIKCKGKNITKEQVEACRPWLEKEIEKVSPFIILALGNTNLKFFKNIDTGIFKWNGSTEWNEEYKAWICYCVHPSCCLYDKNENMPKLKEGINNFIEKIEQLGGFE